MLADFLNILFSPFGGVSVVLIGLASALGKIWVDKTIQAYKKVSDEELKKTQSELDKAIRLLQSELDKGIHIHKVQFEKEFRIYEEIWSNLVDVKKKALSLRPTLDSIDPSEQEEERMRRRLQELASAFNPFVDLVEKHRPFYPSNVYSSLINLVKEIHGEAIDYEYSERKRSEYFKEARKNQEKIVALIEEVCESIRARVSSVVPI
jgi:hypothetical protein